MPITKVRTPDGGLIKVNHPEGASQEEILEYAMANYKGGQGGNNGRRVSDSSTVADMEGDTLGARALGSLETLATMASGAIAEPVAGLTGIAAQVLPGGNTGAEQVRATQEALTYSPRTQQGQQQLQAVGETLAPVGEALQAVEQGAGDAAFEATGSPAVGAVATAIPTLLTEIAGAFFGGRAAKGALKTRVPTEAQVSRAVAEAVPDVSRIRDATDQIYKGIDDAGVVVKPKAFNALALKVENIAEKMGR